MRYRAWDKLDKRMREVIGISFLTGYIECEASLLDDPMKYSSVMYVLLQKGEYILMQSTELEDKTGIEIFDGDIAWSDYDEVYGQVVWRDGVFYFEWEDISELLNEVNGEIQVCGNICANSNLVEREENK